MGIDSGWYPEFCPLRRLIVSRLSQKNAFAVAENKFCITRNLLPHGFFFLQITEVLRVSRPETGLYDLGALVVAVASAPGVAHQPPLSQNH